MEKLLEKVRIVRYSTGEPAAWNAVGRELIIWVISTLTLGMGYLIIHFVSKDGQGRTWYDKMTDTIVLDLRAQDLRGVSNNERLPGGMTYSEAIALPVPATPPVGVS